jgi:hypothetical protein
LSKLSTKFSRRLSTTKKVLFLTVFAGILTFLLLVGIFGSLTAGYAAAQASPTPAVSATPSPAATPNPASQSDLLLLQAQLQNQAQQLQQAQQDAFDAKNSAGAAVTLSLIAILFGIVGLVVGALAILRSRARTVRTNDSTEIEAG